MSELRPVPTREPERERREAAFWDLQAEVASDEGLRCERIAFTPIDRCRLAG